jgi:hypothetical protein
MGEPFDLPEEPRRRAGRYLRIADALLPGRISGFYVVGSTALGAYRPGRSDIDFVAVVDGSTLSRRELARLRAVYVLSGLLTGGPALARRRFLFPGTCNGVFVRSSDLGRPVAEITALASHGGTTFSVGKGFDVNPVCWTLLADGGIALRGPEPSTLGLRPDPHVLQAWTLGNLDCFWSRWARTVQARSALRILPWWRSHLANSVLTPSRMHHTVATGTIITKEAAGAHALAAFPSEWHPLIHEAVAHRRGEPTRLARSSRIPAVRASGDFIVALIADAHALHAARPRP